MTAAQCAVLILYAAIAALIGAALFCALVTG